MLKISDPPLLVRIYFTTPPHKNIYMIHGTRGYQKVAKSCNKIYTPENFTCKYIERDNVVIGKTKGKSKMISNVYVYICVKTMRSVSTPNPHPPPPR